MDISKKGSELIKPISLLSGFDMAIENSEGFVLCGTGNWVDKIGTYRPSGSYFDLTLKNGKPYTCTDTKRSPQCYKCPLRKECPYSFTASAPIIIDGEVAGLVGYLGYQYSQKESFLKRQSVLMDVLRELTSLTKTFISDSEQQDFGPISKIYVEILNELNEGVMLLDSRLRVTYTNNAASSFLDIVSKELIGQKLKTKFPEVAEAFSNFENNISSKKVSNTNRFYKSLKSNLYGTLSLHKWDKENIRFVIFKDSTTDILSSNIKKNARTQEAAIFENVIGESKAINDAKAVAARLAQNDSSILISGETGVGKEIFARSIHRGSSRHANPFVVVNCAAIPEALAESELFGYEKGAFSGASLDGKQGKFEAAEGGTLLLDEIGELPYHLQSKLLRAVEQFEIEKVGATKPGKVNVRIIAATNRDLKSLIIEGKFREDLYYRLNVMPLRIPPLRERPEDIPVLIKHFLCQYDSRKRGLYEYFTTELIGALLAYDWPGNVRELINICQYLVNNHSDGPLTVDNLPPDLYETLSENIVPELKKPNCTKSSQPRRKIRSVDKMIIFQALEKYGKDTAGKKKAASEIGISLSTLYRKMKTYKLININ